MLIADVEGLLAVRTIDKTNLVRCLRLVHEIGGHPTCRIGGSDHGEPRPHLGHGGAHPDPARLKYSVRLERAAGPRGEQGAARVIAAKEDQILFTDHYYVRDCPVVLDRHSNIHSERDALLVGQSRQIKSDYSTAILTGISDSAVRKAIIERETASE